MDRNQLKTKLYSDDSGSSVSIHRNVSRSRIKSANNYPKSDRGYKRHGHYKYLLTVGLSVLFPSQALANVGGVSATAAPVANSSGSVTNQAIQVLQGPYITNTYGGGIQCQGPTRNFTPYVTGSASATKPYEPYYYDPVYDMRDMDEDGAPDNPGSILYRVPVRTGQKDNYNLGVGFSITWSEPLDKQLQDQCKEAAAANIALMKQTTANKRLDFEIARLKNCGELLKAGIQFHPKSPYYSVCADVVVNNPPGHKHPHYHKIPSVSSSSETQNAVPSQPHSSDAALLGAPLKTTPGASYPVRTQSSSLPSSQQASPLLTKDQQEVLRAVQNSSR
jgi:hypothetical protein